MFGVIALVGCGRSGESSSTEPSIERIYFSPPEIPVGNSATATLELRNLGNRGNSQAIFYQWESSNGHFDQEITKGPTCTFVPELSGQARVTVSLVGNGGVISRREQFVTILDKRSTPQNSLTPLTDRSHDHEIILTDIPHYNRFGGLINREKIAGRVTEMTERDSRNLAVVIYSKTDDFWVQPTAKDPLTTIAADGTFESQIHLGSEYIVLLVDNNFQPPAQTPILPRSEGHIYASIRVPGRDAPTNLGEK